MKQKSIGTESKIYYIIVIFICVMVLAPLLIIGIYNRPCADDYDYSFLTHQAILDGKGLFGILSAAWETDIYFYNTWQGLYSSAFILSVQPAIWGEQMYCLTPFIVMLCGYIFTLFSIHLLNRLYLRKPFIFSVTLSLVLFTLLMIWLPSATEGLYWYNGAMNYMPWVFTNFFNICLLLYLKDKSISLKSISGLVLSSILSFLTSGGNHVTAFANILFLLILSVYFAYKKRYLLVLPFVVACVGFVIMYVAPGTAVRFNALTQSSVLKTLCAVSVKIMVLACDWIDIHWLLSLMVITPLGIEIANKNKGKFSWSLSFIALLSSVLVVGGMLAVPYYATSSFGQGRLINVIWITFTFLSWANYILLLGLLIQKEIINPNHFISPRKLARYIPTLLICLGLLISVVTIDRDNQGAPYCSNSVRSIVELLTGSAQVYSKEMDERIEMYHNPAITEVRVKPLTTESMLFMSDIGTDPNCWPNTSISKYYGKTIYLVP